MTDKRENKRLTRIGAMLRFRAQFNFRPCFEDFDEWTQFQGGISGSPIDAGSLAD